VAELPNWVRILIQVELGAVALGVIVGLLTFLVLLLRSVLDRTALVSPEEFKEERTEAEGGEYELDGAWPWYFRRQIHADGRAVQAGRKVVDKKLWSWLGARLFVQSSTPGMGQRFGPLWLFIPYPMLVLPFLFGTFAIAAICNVLYLAVAYVALAIAWVGFGLTVGALRGVEAAWLRLHHTSASCPSCFYVSERPAYMCSGCAALHRDIRPGRLGVFERRCECGELMPTMVLRAAWSRQAACQRCGEPLREGAAALRDVRVAIFGDVSAGKTRLLYASLDSITASAAAQRLALVHPDDGSRQLADTALATIRAGQDTTKTDVALPRAVTFRLGTGSNATLVHLFDAAGELYRDRERYEDVGFLENGHGLIFVVDPFSLAAVRARVAGDATVARHLDDAAGEDPELAYNQVVGQLRDVGVKAGAQRLAIVVSKADLLEQSSIELPTGSAEIADWLRENGLHNVVLAADNEFAEARYFVVASGPAAKATPGTDAGAPLRWHLRARGVSIPAEPEPVVVSEAAGE
jgi:hypothetical protein